MTSTQGTVGRAQFVERSDLERVLDVKAGSLSPPTPPAVFQVRWVRCSTGWIKRLWVQAVLNAMTPVPGARRRKRRGTDWVRKENSQQDPLQPDAP